MKGTDRHIRKINAQAEHLLDEMSLHGPKILRRPPVADAWTPLQVLHHITMVERTSIDYLLYKFGTANEPPPRLTLRNRLTGKVVALALVSPMKFKAPSIVDSAQLAPAASLDLDTLAHQMRSNRVELAGVLERLPEAWHRGAAYRHVTGGRMSLNDMMLFLRAHQDRHAKQIRRGLAQNARYYRRKEAG